ncbi:signal peptidase II [Azospirillum sp. 11R-A]|uniref:signal peptidase II n=1 Tax=Azospirillum sp. 11R-A TaxID=3111634 RepID=UPI003C137106
MAFRWCPAGLYIAMAMAVIAVVADQVSKWAMLTHILTPADVIQITPFFNLRLGFNTGVSFGLFSGHMALPPFVLAGFALSMALVLLGWGARLPDRPSVLAAGAMAGGAIGNAVDRIRQGAVTDFLDLHAFGWHWPTFNLADILIVGGAVVIAFRPSPRVVPS